MSPARYAFLVGATSKDAGNDNRDVICLRASLSEQDLLSVDSASARDGLRRTTPRTEKWARPSRSLDEISLDALGCSLSFDAVCPAGSSQGVGSSCEAMQSSILASPHGAQVQYI